MRSLLLLFTFLLFVPGHFGQDAEPVLLDSFDRIACSDLTARLDRFLVNLANDPASTGYVALSSEADYLKVFRRRRLVDNYVLYRRFDRDRIVFVRRKRLPENGIELWKVQKGSKLPFEFQAGWPYALPQRTKPFILIAGGRDESECSPPSDIEFISQFLKANPRSRSNIVIRCNERDCFRQRKREIIKELATYRVPRARLRFFYLPTNSDYYSHEYWILN